MPEADINILQEILSEQKRCVLQMGKSQRFRAGMLVFTVRPP
jgi:hypothetical protein